MTKYPKLCKVEALENHNLILYFSNNEKKIFDFNSYLTHPYYQNLKNYAFFKNIALKDGELEWATGQDFCPHTLYENSVNIE